MQTILLRSGISTSSAFAQMFRENGAPISYGATPEGWIQALNTIYGQSYIGGHITYRIVNAEMLNFIINRKAPYRISRVAVVGKLLGDRVLPNIKNLTSTYQSESVYIIESPKHYGKEASGSVRPEAGEKVLAIEGRIINFPDVATDQAIVDPSTGELYGYTRDLVGYAIDFGSDINGAIIEKMITESYNGNVHVIATKIGKTDGIAKHVYQDELGGPLYFHIGDYFADVDAHNCDMWDERLFHDEQTKYDDSVSMGCRQGMRLYPQIHDYFYCGGLTHLEVHMNDEEENNGIAYNTIGGPWLSTTNPNKPSYYNE